VVAPMNDVMVSRLDDRCLTRWRGAINSEAEDCAVARVRLRRTTSDVVDLAEAREWRELREWESFLRQQEADWDLAARSMWRGDLLRAIADPARARKHAEIVAARPLEETNTEVQRLRAELNDLAAAHRILLEHLRSKVQEQGT
jgi:DMSO/TMAO reductase YedYZ molybdopterin-dependent catalytic subunit